MDFSKIKARKKNTRKAGTSGRAKGQSYTDFKFKVNNKGVSNFQIANDKFDELGLDSKALVHYYVEGEGVFIGLVSDDTSKVATMYKKATKSSEGKKTKYFNASVLEADLISDGQLKAVEEGSFDEGVKYINQFLELQPVEAEALPEGVEKMFKLVASSEKVVEKSESETEESVEEVAETTEPEVVSDSLEDEF